MTMVKNVPNNADWQYISVGQPNCTYQCRHPLFTLLPILYSSHVSHPRRSGLVKTSNHLRPPSTLHLTPLQVLPLKQHIHDVVRAPPIGSCHIECYKSQITCNLVIVGKIGQQRQTRQRVLSCVSRTKPDGEPPKK